MNFLMFKSPNFNKFRYQKKAFMPFTISTQNNDDYLFVESQGNIESADELVAHANQIYEEFLKHHQTKVLIYQMETEFPPGLSSYLNLVNHYIDNFSIEIMSVRIAVVIQEKYKELGAFWETVCNNRGYQYHAFTSLEEAEDWLKKE
jgi:hypothetical protein